MTSNVTKGSVFDDLFDGKEAANLKVRAELMTAIDQWVHSNRLKQKDAAEILGIKQSRVSDLVNGKIDKFTVDFLINLLALTEQKVELKIKAA